ncbi:uncharacterized protein [Oryctolagus cuniculus]|uniref:uncharacterized protein isoform X1 n=1 Tax=Oryctolagus cuniculus TaxID=9986 RepID=UPI00222E60E4|nr:uncharacterized protein LOC103348030 isoform X7 [Oryctolagus cuniculus]
MAGGGAGPWKRGRSVGGSLLGFQGSQTSGRPHRPPSGAPDCPARMPSLPSAVPSPYAQGDLGTRSLRAFPRLRSPGWLLIQRGTEKPAFLLEGFPCPASGFRHCCPAVTVPCCRGEGMNTLVGAITASIILYAKVDLSVPAPLTHSEHWAEITSRQHMPWALMML